MNHSIELVLILLALAIGVTALAKKAKKPYPIALVLMGALIGFLPSIEVFEQITEFFAAGEVYRTAIVAVFLPALLGEAALKLPMSQIRDNFKPIMLLAFLGTFLAFAVTAGLTYSLLGLHLSTALVFGALMGATDPVSVISLFKTMNVSKRLTVIMEGESLLNDGVSVVLFNISAFTLASILAAGPLGIASGLMEFIRVILGGTVIGLSMGFIFSNLGKMFDDYPLEIAFSVLLFYGSYFISESIHVSGVIAVVTAGLVLGNYGTKIGMSPTVRLSVTVFWDTLTLVANSLVFILTGIELATINIFNHFSQLSLAIIIVIIGRSAAVYLSTIFTEIHPKWKHILNWGGLKGALSLALALSLPYDFPGREMLLVITFGVVFFSLVVQGLTVSPLIRMLNLQKSTVGLKDYENLTARLQQAISASSELGWLRKEARVSPHVHELIKEELSEEIEKINKCLTELYKKHPGLLKQQETDARKKLLFAEHQAVERLLSEGVLSIKTGEERQREILEKIEALGD